MTRSVFQRYARNEDGEAIPLAEIDVVVTEGPVADIFTSETGGSAISQPLIAQADGFIRFYVEPGLYDVTATDPVLFSSVTFEREEIGTSRETLIDDDQHAKPYSPLNKPDAVDVIYDNSSSELSANDVQAAIDEVVANTDLINDLSQAYELATVAAMESSTINFPLNKIIDVLEIDSNSGGKASYKVVLTSSITPDSLNVVLSVGVPANSYKKILAGDIYLEGESLGIGLNFIQQINSDQRDVYMLVQGDSTSNETIEWVGRTADTLFEKYPSYTVLYYLWNEGINDFDPPTIRGSGSGSNTVHVYNGSRGGAAADYFLYKQRPNSYGGRRLDLIIQSYGHNKGGTLDELIGFTSASVAQLIFDQPQAEIALTLQNLWGDEQETSAIQANANLTVAGLFGCSIVDVRSPFLWKNTTGNIDDWLTDGLHPNQVGQQVWAEVVSRSLFNPSKYNVNLNNSLANKTSSPIRNSHFVGWDWSAEAPFGNWSKQACTAERDTSIFETGNSSMKLEGTTASTGFMILVADDYINKLNLSGGLTFMARVFYNGSWITTDGSTIEIISNLGVGRSFGRSGSAVLQEGWAWRICYIPPELLIGVTSLDFAIWTGRTGDLTWVDRINVVEGRLPHEPEYNQQETFLDYYFDGNVGSNAENTVIVTGDSVEHSASTGVNVQWFINYFGLEVGEEYTMQYTYSGANTSNGVLFREGLNDSGTVVIQVNDLTLGKATFRATTTQGSVQVFNTLGSVPYTLSDIKILKGRV